MLFEYPEPIQRSEMSMELELPVMKPHMTHLSSTLVTIGRVGCLLR